MSLLFFSQMINSTINSMINSASNGVSGLFAATPQSVGFLFMLAVGILFINAFLLAGFGVVGAAFLKRMQISSTDLEREKREAHEKAEVQLEIARKESLLIVDEANKKAGRLLEQTQVVKEQIETQLAEAIRQFSEKERERVAHVSTQLIDAYRTMIESTKQQYGTAAAGTAKEMADTAQKSLKEFEQYLKDQTTRYEGTLKEHVQAGFMSAQKDISDYKRESLRKVEDAIYRILNLVTKSVLGKALSLEDQQDLVIHALTEAKQQAFFEI